MPTLTINHEDPADIRNSIALLAKFLPEETLFLVNTTNKTELEDLITNLQGHLANLPAMQVGIWPESAAYDELVTQDIIIELAKTWPQGSNNFTQMWMGTGRRSSLERLKSRLRDKLKPLFGSQLNPNIYKGHILHPFVYDELTDYAKQGRFWKYVMEQWKMQETEEGWIPPNLR